jgi:hypothetical protein
MANSYTYQLKLRKPTFGDGNWDDEINGNSQILEVALAAVLEDNYTVSGLVASAGSGLAVDYTSGVVVIAGTQYAVGSGSKTATDNTDGTSAPNFLYVDNAGVMQISTTPPTGEYVPIAVVDTLSAVITRVGDLRYQKTIGEGKNIVINGGFTINQRGYVSAATLASGAYGHDRWKGGAGGGNYSFTQLASNTQITIAANKTLIQVIENKNVASTSYVLSWEGTALARYAVNSATPAGSYAASPILITGQTAGAAMSIEFGNGASSGTLGKVQLEAGTIATRFQERGAGDELAMCQRYYYRRTSTGAEVIAPAGFADSSTVALCSTPFPVEMRAAPTALEQTGTASNYVIRTAGDNAVACSSVPAFNNGSIWGSRTLFTVASGLTGGHSVNAQTSGAGVYLAWSAEL